MANTSYEPVAGVLDSTADELSSHASALADGAAKVIEETTQYLRDKRPADLLADLGTRTKANPVAFLLGALALGFVAGRMIRRG